MDVIKKGFGSRLKDLRRINHYTQEQLSEKIGINLRQLARIEAGESFVTSETLYKICTVLDISPWVLFDFDIITEQIKTGTDNILYFNAIKTGNSVNLITKKQGENKPQEGLYVNFDEKMKTMARQLKKVIIVDEIINGIQASTKRYYPNGTIDIKYENKDNPITILKNKINKISSDNNKIEFMNLAFDSLYDKLALNKLKILLQGIELMHA